MVQESLPTLAWVILTMGDRPEALRAAIASLLEASRATPGIEIVVVSNGGGPLDVEDSPAVRVVELAENIGIPAGRNTGAAATEATLIGFLDDDARLLTPIDDVVGAFAADDDLAVAALRLVDEHGETAQRHVPRVGGRDAAEAGPVALFLGGACVMRRRAFEQVGGYWGELWYGHEELELAWRLVDGGWRLCYSAEVTVFHPRTDIGRHPAGWEHTGRNRVMIARRTLPWPIAIAHVTTWLLLGGVRAAGAESRRAYLRGWRRGWQQPVTRRPIRWSTVSRLTRLGRPPVL